MSGPLERAVSVFLAPAAERVPAPRRVAAPPGDAPSAAVIGTGGDAMAVAHLLAAELRLRTRARCALVAEWRGDAVQALRPGVCGPGARQLCERLAARGIEATARGQVVHLPLPSDPATATATLRRAAAAAGVPAVCAVAGPRPPEFDSILDDQDLVVVVPPAGAGQALAGLVLDGLADVHAPVVICRPVGRGVARLLSLSAATTSRALGTSVAEAVRELA